MHSGGAGGTMPSGGGAPLGGSVLNLGTATAAATAASTGVRIDRDGQPQNGREAQQRRKGGGLGIRRRCRMRL